MPCIVGSFGGHYGGFNLFYLRLYYYYKYLLFIRGLSATYIIV